MWSCVGKYAVVKKIGSKYKLVVMSTNDFISASMLRAEEPERRNRGDRSHFDEPFPEDADPWESECKFEQSLQRAKRTIFELGMCNDWEYFITFTLDPAKYDRYNLDAFHKDLTHWLRNYRRKIGQKISFVLVPERHKDGAWHIHGFLHGLPAEFLSRFVFGIHPAHLVNGNYWNWPDYEKKFGFCSLAPIRIQEAASCYITKYITKDVSRLNNEFGAHLYYASRPLNCAVILHQDFITAKSICFDYMDEKCGIKTYNSLEECLENFKGERVIAGRDDELSFALAMLSGEKKRKRREKYEREHYFEYFEEITDENEIAEADRAFAQQLLVFENMEFEPIKMEGYKNEVSYLQF